MTGRKTAYFVCPELERCFLFNKQFKPCLDKDIVKVYVYNEERKDLKVKLLFRKK
jgi:hypothetical protein